MMSRDRSKYRVRRSRVSSASRLSARVVNPTRSANRIETRRRSATGAATAGVGWGTRGAATDARGPTNDVAHSPQNLTVGSFPAPHFGHTTTRGEAHSPQNLRPAVLGAPQFEQITTAS